MCPVKWNYYGEWMGVPYNLSTWLCMKKESIILSMLIPGPKAQGDFIDVYLQPLIEELEELWEVDVPIYDTSNGEVFECMQRYIGL